MGQPFSYLTWLWFMSTESLCWLYQGLEVEHLVISLEILTFLFIQYGHEKKKGKCDY